MAEVTFVLPDGNSIAVSEGSSYRDAVSEIGAGLAQWYASL